MQTSASPISPAPERVFGWHDHASLWFSLGVGLLVMQIGAYLVPAVGTRDAALGRMAVRKTMPTYAELQAKVAELEHRLSLAFSVEEMDILREQLADRAVRAEEAYEALEWRLRAELQRVRDAGERCSAAAREMQHAASSVAMLFDDEEEATDVRPTPMHRLLQ